MNTTPAPRPNGVTHRPVGAVRPPNQAPVHRRAVAVDVPADADAELSAMALVVATLEALGPTARARVARWAGDRYGIGLP